MKIINVILTTVLLLLLTTCPATASDYLELNREMYEWINQARSNPLRFVRKFKIDEERARQALGDRQWILDTEIGLSRVPWSFTLFNSAESHNRDMMEKLYFSYDSPDGRTPAQRMTEHGCFAENKEEIIGAIVLYMYIDPREAIEAMFEYMLEDELNPDTDTAINFFNPELREFGISFLAGQITIVEGTIANVYLVVADFAHSSCEGNLFPPQFSFNPMW